MSLISPEQEMKRTVVKRRNLWAEESRDTVFYLAADLGMIYEG